MIMFLHNDCPNGEDESNCEEYNATYTDRHSQVYTEVYTESTTPTDYCK